jgi:hypothetical protein
MIINKEYDSTFPVDQEYQLWIQAVERDYREESQYRAKLAVTNRTRTVLYKNDEFSPFNTVNS